MTYHQGEGLGLIQTMPAQRTRRKFNVGRVRVLNTLLTRHSLSCLATLRIAFWLSWSYDVSIATRSGGLVVPLRLLPLSSLPLSRDLHSSTFKLNLSHI